MEPRHCKCGRLKVNLGMADPLGEEPAYEREEVEGRLFGCFNAIHATEISSEARKEAS